MRVKSHSARQTIFRYLVAVSLAGALALAGCGGRHIAAIPPGNSGGPNEPSPTVSPASNPNGASSSPAAPARTVPRASETPGASYERGLASWYGLPFNGRRSANGEIYDMNKFTAAHRTLPFDTVVRVTNLENGLQTEVRITDRGPFVEDRVIDLSYAAARAIGMVGTGTARVRLDIMASDASSFSDPTSNASPAPRTPAASSSLPTVSASDGVTNRVTVNRPASISSNWYFTVQVGAFGERANAERLKQQLDPRYRPVMIQDYDGANGQMYRVRVGNCSTEAAARDLAQKLSASDGIRGVVVRQDESAARGGEHQ